MRRLLAIVLVALAPVMVVTSTAGAAQRKKIRRPGPRRVLILGDSIGVGYEDGVARQLRAQGDEVVTAAENGWGILDAGECGAKAADLVALVDPDVVVFDATGNYSGAGKCPPEVTYGSSPFYQQWRAAIRLERRTLTSRKSRFVWVLPPSTHWYQQVRNRVLNKLTVMYRAQAGEHVDAYGDGIWNPAIHKPDGFHLTASASQWLGNLIVEQVGSG